MNPPAGLPAPSRRIARLARGLAWASLALAAAGGVGELIAGLGYRAGWWGVGPGIRGLGISAMVAGAGVLLALAALPLAARARSRGALAAAAAGLLIAATVSIPPFHLWRQASRLPAIHDISTDTEDPPRFAAVLALRQGAPNGVEFRAEVAAQQKAAYPDIAPALLDVPPERAFAMAQRAAQASGWEIVAASPAALRIEATATTRLFGFKDDVVIRITPAPQGSRVDLRSVSRVGRGDLGANAARIRAFVRRLDAERRRP